jgi:hypothetical protein
MEMWKTRPFEFCQIKASIIPIKTGHINALCGVFTWAPRLRAIGNKVDDMAVAPRAHQAQSPCEDILYFSHVEVDIKTTTLYN